MRLWLALLVAFAALVAAAAPSACDTDPNSYQCLIDRDREGDSKGHQNAQKAVQDEERLSAIVTRFETLTNQWGCATTGFSLFDAAGDGDVMTFAFEMLAQTLLRNGQHHGSQLVRGFFISRGKQEPRGCEGVATAPGAREQHYGAPATALLQLKSDLQAWLQQHEVDTTEIMGFFIPQIRSLYGRWAMARLLAMRDKDRELPPEVPLAVLPIIEQEENTEDRCHVGGQLYAMFRNRSVADRAKIDREISALLDDCFSGGRISAKPAEYGEILLASGREAKARELFDLAVQRGSLCNAYQRPEMLLRKDLTASPVWGLDAFPKAVGKALLGVQDLVAAAVRRRDFVFANDTETMRFFVERGGPWERTLLYAASTWHEFNCLQFGEPGCAKLRRLVDTILDANDGFTTVCNGSLVLDLWRMPAGTLTLPSTGQSNIVLQVLMPLVGRGHGVAMLANVGEEAVMIGEGDVVVMDDSFENTLAVQRDGPAPATQGDDAEAGAQDPTMVLFHVQLCHPELHDKALDLPSKRCAK